jgi:ABC-type transporter Mla MlaB component
VKATTIQLDISGHVAPADIPALCDRARDLVERSAAKGLVCDVRSIIDPDAATVDALARILLTARRLECRMRVRNASAELRDLLDLAGLSGVVPLVPDQDSGRVGSPNIGKKRWVSRKNVIPLIRPSDNSST